MMTGDPVDVACELSVYQSSEKYIEYRILIDTSIARTELRNHIWKLDMVLKNAVKISLCQQMKRCLRVKGIKNNLLSISLLLNQQKTTTTIEGGQRYVQCRDKLDGIPIEVGGEGGGEGGDEKDFCQCESLNDTYSAREDACSQGTDSGDLLPCCNLLEKYKGSVKVPKKFICQQPACIFTMRVFIVGKKFHPASGSCYALL